MRARALALIIALLMIAPASAQTPPSVPREYEDLYSMMDRNVSAFESRVARSWDGRYSDVQFGEPGHHPHAAR